MIAPLEPFRDASCTGRPDSVYERSCRRKDGSKVPVLVGMALLDESDDEVVGFVLDLTAQKHVEAQRALLHDSREALRLRDLFNSIASHELKTPLTALLLSLAAPEQAAGEGGAGQLVAARAGAALRVGRGADGRADSRAAGRRPDPPRPPHPRTCSEMDVVEAVRKVVSGFEVGAGRSGAHRIAVRADGAVTARLDPLRFDQIVTNLLSNAVKYGGGKPIEVRVDHDRAADLGARRGHRRRPRHRSRDDGEDLRALPARDDHRSRSPASASASTWSS